ncbi:3-hydroxyisobutyrate dehydrogenase [Colletotrichum sp. SAR11_240]|nr:3-hydroxyisobutyrate dehydrogenase [Colletotrichum sp. SAR11_240]
MQMRPSTISWRSVLRQQPCRHQLGRHRQLGSERMMTSGATDRTNTIGFIGLGAMGNHMFNNLVNKSTAKVGSSAKYVLFDVNDAAVEGVIQRHQKENPAVSVHKCSSPYDVAQKASTIITMVPTGRHVEDVYLGDSSVIRALKTLLLGITMLGLSEAMLLGKRLGVDPQVLADIINNSTGRCWSSEINHPVPEVKVGDTSPPAHRQYAGGFVTSLAHKDLALAVKAALEVNAPLPLGRRVEEVYRPLAQMTEWGSRDFSVIYEALDEAIVGHDTKKIEP